MRTAIPTRRNVIALIGRQHFAGVLAENSSYTECAAYMTSDFCYSVLACDLAYTATHAATAAKKRHATRAYLPPAWWGCSCALAPLWLRAESHAAKQQYAPARMPRRERQSATRWPEGRAGISPGARRKILTKRFGGP